MVFKMMNDQVRRARAVTLYICPKLSRSDEDHRKEYEAIRSSDADLAAEVHRRRNQNAKCLIVGLLERYKLRGV